MCVQELRVEDLDHLGIIAGICDMIDLVGIIDRLIPPGRRKVSVGERVKAMILNGLGFRTQPLYLTPDFFAHKPVDVLLRPDITAADLNDDALGRALDALYEYGVTELFAQVAAHALQKFGLDVDVYHLDTTSFAVYGDAYETGDKAVGAVRITHGYSRDRRGDLRQVVLALVCAQRTTIPCWLQVLDGNSSDRRTYPRIVNAMVRQMQQADDTPRVLVADSALYTAEHLPALSQYTIWVTRVPRSTALFRHLERQVDPDRMQPAAQAGYRYQRFTGVYAQVQQQWVVVYSEAQAARDRARLTQTVRREAERAQKAWWHLTCRTFETARAAQEAAQAVQKPWRYHTAEFTVVARPRYGRRGRPRANTPPQRIVWQVRGEVRVQPAAVAAAEARCGLYVLATNDLDMPPERVLDLYHAQTATVERGFRFLKDPLFFAHRLFLKTPRRIMALLMVMALALLVYSLAEMWLRMQLQAHRQTVPDQKRRPTARPTMRWVFMLLHGIRLVRCTAHAPPHVYLANFHDLHRRILTLMGPEVLRYYRFPAHAPPKFQKSDLNCGM